MNVPLQSLTAAILLNAVAATDGCGPLPSAGKHPCLTFCHPERKRRTSQKVIDYTSDLSNTDFISEVADPPQADSGRQAKRMAFTLQIA